MRIKEIPQTGKFVKTLICFSIPFFMVATLWAQEPSQGGSPKKELNSIRSEFQQLNQKLRQVQQKAMSTNEVQSQQMEYNKALKTEMLSLADDSQAKKVEKRFKISQSLQEASSKGKDGSVDREALMSKAQELRTIKQTLRPIEQKARQEPEVQERYQSMVKSIRTTMVEMNPKTQEWMQRQSELATRAQQLQQQMQQTQGS